MGWVWSTQSYQLSFLVIKLTLFFRILTTQSFKLIMQFLLCCFQFTFLILDLLEYGSKTHLERSCTTKHTITQHYTPSHSTTHHHTALHIITQHSTIISTCSPSAQTFGASSLPLLASRAHAPNASVRMFPEG